MMRSSVYGSGIHSGLQDQLDVRLLNVGDVAAWRLHRAAT
jgi:hypothetical protein